MTEGTTSIEPIRAEGYDARCLSATVLVCQHGCQKGTAQSESHGVAGSSPAASPTKSGTYGICASQRLSLGK
jgi:hypothetical protein